MSFGALNSHALNSVALNAAASSAIVLAVASFNVEASLEPYNPLQLHNTVLNFDANVQGIFSSTRNTYAFGGTWLGSGSGINAEAHFIFPGTSSWDADLSFNAYTIREVRAEAGFDGTAFTDFQSSQIGVVAWTEFTLISIEPTLSQASKGSLQLSSNIAPITANNIAAGGGYWSTNSTVFGEADTIRDGVTTADGHARLTAKGVFYIDNTLTAISAAGIELTGNCYVNLIPFVIAKGSGYWSLSFNTIYAGGAREVKPISAFGTITTSLQMDSVVIGERSGQWESNATLALDGVRTGIAAIDFNSLTTEMVGAPYVIARGLFDANVTAASQLNGVREVRPTADIELVASIAANPYIIARGLMSTAASATIGMNANLNHQARMPVVVSGETAFVGYTTHATFASAESVSNSYWFGVREARGVVDVDVTANTVLVSYRVRTAHADWSGLLGTVNAAAILSLVEAPKARRYKVSNPDREFVLSGGPRTFKVSL